MISLFELNQSMANLIGFVLSEKNNVKQLENLVDFSEETASFTYLILCSCKNITDFVGFDVKLCNYL